MIEDLDMTLRLADSPTIHELIVSRGVLLKLLQRPEATEIRLNLVQDSRRYRYLHSVRLRGKLFIHPSRHHVLHPLGIPAAKQAEPKMKLQLTME